MSKFLEQIREHQQHLEHLEEQGNPVSYRFMQAADMLKPVTFRIPITTAAMLDELQNYGPWATKQEMVYEILDGAIGEFLISPVATKSVRDRFRELAQAALSDWETNNPHGRGDLVVGIDPPGASESKFPRSALTGQSEEAV